MKKFVLYLLALVTGALTLLFADAHHEREKERESREPQKEVRESRERMHLESLEIHEAVREGRISHEDGRKKIDALKRRLHDHQKEKFWKRVEEEIEGAAV